MADTSADADTTLDKHNALVNDAVRLLLTNQFRAAQRLFDQHQSEDCTLMLAHSLVLYLRAISSYGDSDLDDALAFIWKTEHQARSLSQSRAPLTRIEGELIQADTHLLGSMIQFLQQSFVKMAWNVRKSHQFYAKARHSLDRAERESDAGGDDSDTKHRLAVLRGWEQFGSGLFSLMLSLLPPTVLKIAEYVGYEGDRDAALLLLKQSYQSPSFMAPFAALLLLSFYLTIATFTGQEDASFLVEARAILDWAQLRYSGGALFALMESRYYRANVQPREAIDVAQRGVQSITEFPPLGILFYYQSGWCGLYLLEFSEAASYFDALLHQRAMTAEHSDVETQAVPPTRASSQTLYAYIQGLCYLMTGDFGRGGDSLASVPSWLQRKSKPIDAFALRKSAQMLNRRTITVDDALLELMELLLAWNSLPQMPATSVERCQSMLADANDRQCKLDDSDDSKWTLEQQLRYQWISQSVRAFNASADQLDESRASLESLLAEHNAVFQQSKELQASGLYAFIAYEIAQINFARNELDAAQEWLLRAKQPMRFDLHNILQLKLRALGQKIQRAERSREHE